MTSMGRALRYLSAYWPAAGGALISMLLVSAANLIAPQLLRILIDQGIGRLDLRVVGYASGGLALVAVGRGLFNFLQGYWSEVASQGVAYDLRNAIFARLQKLSFSYHDRTQTGRLMTRMTSDVELVRVFAGGGLIQLLSGLALLLGAAVILFWMNALLAVLVLLTIPAIGFALVLMIKAVMPLSRQIQSKLGALNSILQENLAGARVVKAFGREAYEQARFARQNETLLGDNLTMLRAFTTYFPLVFFFANLGTVAVVWVGGLLVMEGSLTVGDLVAFTSYLGFMLAPVFMLGMLGAMYSRAAASAERVFEVIDAEPDVSEDPQAIRLPPLQGRVEFEGVSFRYVGMDEPALSDISFTVEPGQTVAVLGATGAGKSSLTNLIPRFYNASSGRVLVDGVDVRQVNLESLRSQIGMVLQETTLFSGTIHENIAYGRPKATRAEVEAAAQAAQAHEFIQVLPEGYDTRVGERGAGLSGGQKQRLAIARALLVEPRILILDDSVSAVDAETEHQIWTALEHLRQGRTSFVIAHRLASVLNADLILVLDEGRLRAQGRHADLLQESELYAEILASQYGAQEDRLFEGDPLGSAELAEAEGGSRP
jgi:ATP-binding cassette, subfamily B, multidrug efflux pump